MSKLLKSALSVAVATTACSMFVSQATAAWIPNVTATASSFDTLNYEGFGVYSAGGSQIIGSGVREEFIRHPTKMVNGDGLVQVTAPSGNSNGVFYHTGNMFANVSGTGNAAWLSIDGPGSGPKTVDIYPSRPGTGNSILPTAPRRIKDIVTTADAETFTFGPDRNPVVNFDLGKVADIDAIHVWNWCEAYGVGNGSLARGVRKANFQTSADGITFSAPQQLTLPIADEAAVISNQYYGDDLAFSATGIRYVRMTVINNYAGPASATQLDFPAGIAEIRFNETVVPEPASVAALSVAGLALFRRRRA